MTPYDRFEAFTKTFCNNHAATPVMGDYYDLPETTVYHSATHPLAGGGRIEVNTITSQAPSEFEWQQEVTLNDKAEKRFIHLIIRHDQSVVETYGKTVLPVNDDRADEILSLLRQQLAA